MGKSQRIKGRRGEQEVVNYWKPLFPKAKRHLEFQDEEAELGIDVEVLKNFLECQVKIGGQVPKTIYKYMNQMKPSKTNFQFVQCKRDREDWLVIMKADDFKELMQMLKKEQII